MNYALYLEDGPSIEIKLLANGIVYWRSPEGSCDLANAKELARFKQRGPKTHVAYGFKENVDCHIRFRVSCNFILASQLEDQDTTDWNCASLISGAEITLCESMGDGREHVFIQLQYMH